MKNEVELLKSAFAKAHSHVTYLDAKRLLTPEEFAEFDGGCRLATKHLSTPREEIPEPDRTAIDRSYDLRKIAAERKAIS